MKLLVSLLALALPALAWAARPILIPAQKVELPYLVEPQYPGDGEHEYHDVAIDGGELLVYATRRTGIEGNPLERAIHVLRRQPDATWAYAGLFPDAGGENIRGVEVNGDIAIVLHSTGARIYERNGTGWLLATNVPVGGPNYFRVPFRIDDGVIYFRRGAPSSPSCVPPYEEWRKVSGSWQQVATIGGQVCTNHGADINDGRFIFVQEPEELTERQPPARIYADNSGTAWTPVANFPSPEPNLPYLNWFGVRASLSGRLAYIDGGYVYRNRATTGNDWTFTRHHVQPESDLELRSGGSNGLVMRGNYLFLGGREIDYWLPSEDWEVIEEWRTVRVYRANASNSFDYYARLNAEFDLWNWTTSEDGRYVAALAPNNNQGYDPTVNLYVYEIPDTTTIPSTRQDNFESGNHARWTPYAGQFSVVQQGVSRVLRQASTTGDSGAFLTAQDWTDQSIEADLRPTAFSGTTNRWFGLVTRRTDASNYYYVTFRPPNTISLRRLQDGAVTVLGTWTSPVQFVAGRNYRVRLESAGEQHAVFINGIPVLTARDAALTHGHPGIAGYRTAFQTDNVVTSGSTRILLRSDLAGMQSQPFDHGEAEGSWAYASFDGGSAMRQSNDAITARWFSNVRVGNQVVSARLRPVSFGTTTGDPWVGVAARVADENNYVYAILRRSGKLSLRKLASGSIQQLANVSLPVTAGTWHDLRLEVIGNDIRVFLDGELRIQVNDGTIPSSGAHGLLTYRAVGDFTHMIGYQP